MKLKPLNQTVIVRRVTPEEKSPGGILIPQSAQERTNEGIVEAAPKDAPVKKGDKVLFNRYGGSEMKVAGKEHLIIGYKELLAVIEE